MTSFRRWASALCQSKSSQRSRGNGRDKRRSKRARRFEALESRLAFSTTPLITEFVASNNSTLNDGDGVASDWIEIHNPTDQVINLAGWHLTDNSSNLDKWTFPSLPQSILDPGEYLIVFASSKSIETYVDPLGYLHTDFALSADGEYLGLTDPDENIIHEYAPTFHRQIQDVSYGLLQNTSTLTLVGPSHNASVLVPTTGSLDAPSADVPPQWTLPAFNDASWLTSGGGPGVGFDFGDDVVPTPPNGTLLPGGLIGFDLTDANENGVLDGTIFSGGSSPGNEDPDKALDNTAGTKWLAFEPEGTFYGFRFAAGQEHALNGYTITSANDAPERDPYSWTLSGSNDGVNYTVVDARTAQDFASRFETRLYEFNNNTPYEYYRFDFQTEFGATGQNEPNSIQMAEIELLSSGPVDFDPLIDLDVEAQWIPPATSVYQRIEFDVADPAALASLLLEMQYDDGFVAYLNGKRVASANAQSLPNFNSNATGERDDSDSLVAESFNLTKYLDDLVAGTNVLSIHVLNVSDASSDLLARAQLRATQVIDDTIVEAYMPQPSPGAPNVFDGVTLGPIISDVTENVPQPAAHENIIVTAQVSEAGTPINEVLLNYRVMYDSEVAIAMNDTGIGSDAIAGDGIYTGVIPESAFSAGQMVRWYVTANDTVGDESRYPLFINPAASPEYFGTVIQTPGLDSNLPIFEYFVENVGASGTESGTRGSVYFRGEFYDNVFIRRRGGNTTQGRKFEFNDGHHFLFDPAHPRVDEINLNERGAEPTYMRQVLAWDVYGAAGVPASIGEAWHTRINNSHLDVRIFVEQPDSDMLRRTGLDENGAFYKIGADGVENSVTSSTNGVRKRTRKHEDNSDLQALVDGVSPRAGDNPQYVFDHIDIAAAINYIAATSIIHDNDHPHKNFHLYRDTEGSGQWTLIPWDKDLTFGLNFGLFGIVADVDPYSHPFFGDEEHQKVDGQWNRMIDALFDIPVVREMYVRRLRTLMDQLILPPGSGETSWIESRVDELTALLQPEVGSTDWLTSVNRIIDEYLVERREHLYVNHSIHNPGYPDNARIPDAQVGNPMIQFGQIEYSPASGNEDEEFIQLVNPNSTAVDISNWRIEGGIEHTFRPGTVIPAGGVLYVSPDVPTFLERTSGPRGGQQLFVQGNYSGKLANEGELIKLVAADNSVIASNGPSIPGDYNLDLVVDDLDYGVWKGAFGSNSPNADGNGDGIVDAADYTVWRDNRGASALGVAFSQVEAANAASESVAAPVAQPLESIVAGNVIAIDTSITASGFAGQLLSHHREFSANGRQRGASLRSMASADAASDELILAVLADRLGTTETGARDELFADSVRRPGQESVFEAVSEFEVSVGPDAFDEALAML